MKEGDRGMNEIWNAFQVYDKELMKKRDRNEWKMMQFWEPDEEWMKDVDAFLKQ